MDEGNAPENPPAPLVMTHGGRHHADELLAIAFLRLRFGNIRIARVSDRKDLEKADIVVDVGGEYDAENDRFDHHGVTNLPVTYDRPGGYASAGLVWRKYGKEICRICLEYPQSGSWGKFYDRVRKVPVGVVDYIHSRLERDIVIPIDCWDNGIRPRADMSRHWLPLQWILPHLEFHVALDAMQTAFIHRLRGMADSFADELKISHDLLENGPTEFYLINEEVLVVAADGDRIEISAASKIVEKALEFRLGGVISSLREGFQWALMLIEELPHDIEIPEGIDSTQTRKMFFAPERKTLLRFARRALTAKGKIASLDS